MNMDANNNQDIIINMDIAKYIGETTEYDKKQEVERRKVKSWLKSVSAFANGGDGCLLFGIADDISGKEFKMIIPCVIKSSERSDFLRFYVYLCHMSDILYLSF